ncbi:MAG: 5-formyltetrahydrofolate cyclo-ligase [Acholeplasmataceae bacterium]
MTKQEIRKHMLKQRNEMHDEERLQQNSYILEQIQKDTAYQNAKVVAIFYPMGSEIDLRGLVSEDKIYVFPRIDIDSMHFYPLTDQTKFNKSKFGVMEPEGDHYLDQFIDYMIAPALAISKDKYRVGYGKGYYDQFLIQHRPARVIGVIYDFQEVLHIDTHPHDQKLDDYIKGNL